MRLELKRFDPSRMRDESVIVIIGKRNTGKSVLTKDLMYHKRHLPAGIVISPTEVGNHFYSTWIPETFIYPKFNRDIIAKVYDTQKIRLKNKTINNVFMILDDCMYDKGFLKDEVMRFAIMNGRHFKTMLVLTAQYCGDLPPEIRNNIDYVFVLRNNIRKEREKLWNNFFGLMPSLSGFCQLMDKTTENHECLVLDNTATSNRVEDCLYWYRADPTRDYKMGSPSFWRFHTDSYNPKHDELVTNDWNDKTKRRGDLNVKKLR